MPLSPPPPVTEPAAAVDAPLGGPAQTLAALVPALLLLLSALGALAGWHDLQVAPLSVLLLVAWAAPLVVLAEPLSWSRLVFWTTTISLSGTCGLGMLLAETTFWHPRAVMVLQVVAALVATGLVLRRERPGLDQWWQTRPRPRAGWNSLIALSVVLILIGGAQRAVPAPSGMRVLVGFLWYLGVTTLVAVVVVQVRRREVPGLGLTLLATLTVATQALLYGAPTVMSAARHIGVVDYVQVHERLDPSLDIYQAWAGLFAGTAYLADAVGMRDPMVLATWWPVPLSAALVLGVRELALALGLTPTRAWVAGAVFGLVNTLNIVYYSPQSMGLLLALGVVALGASGTRRGWWWWSRIVVLSVVMAFTHQLSPYFATAALGVLMLRGLARPWWLPAVPFVPAMLWAYLNRETLGGFVSYKALGRLFQNVQPPSHPTVAGGTPELITRLAFEVPALLLLVVGVIALITILRRRDRLHVALALTALSPASLFVASDYGQEGIFRVVLFALPWLALLVADLPWRFTPTRAAVLAAAVVLAFGVNTFGQTAMDWARVVRPDAVAATREYERTAVDGGTVLMTGTGNATPSKVTARYVKVDYLSRESIAPAPPLDEAYDAVADVALMTRRLVTRRDANDYFALVSDSTGAYDQRYSGQPYERYVALRAAMRVAPMWRLVRSGPTTDLYRLRDAYLFQVRR